MGMAGGARGEAACSMSALCGCVGVKGGEWRRANGDAAWWCGREPQRNVTDERASTDASCSAATGPGRRDGGGGRAMGAVIWSRRRGMLVSTSRLETTGSELLCCAVLLLQASSSPALALV